MIYIVLIYIIIIHFRFCFNNSKITVFPSEYFCPVDYDTGEILVSNNTYMIHHYAGTWQSEESMEIRKLKEQYCQKYGRYWGNIFAKTRYYRKKNGLKGLIKFFILGVRNKIRKFFKRY